MNKTLFVNLYGGPCAGKSVTAAGLFAELKWARVKTELISEYAKQLVFEESYPKLKNQIYILGKQHNKQFMLNGKVDIAVTDSPFILSLIYDEGRTKYLREMAMFEFNKFWNLNIFLEREADAGYDPTGRTQKTQEEAVLRDDEIKKFLDDNGIEYTSVRATKDNLQVIMKLINEEFAKRAKVTAEA